MPGITLLRGVDLITASPELRVGLPLGLLTGMSSDDHESLNLFKPVIENMFKSDS